MAHAFQECGDKAASCVQELCSLGNAKKKSAVNEMNVNHLEYLTGEDSKRQSRGTSLENQIHYDQDRDRVHYLGCNSVQWLSF